MKPPSTSLSPDIERENVSVCYRIPEERIGTFKEYAIRVLQNKVRSHDFMALQSICLSVSRGETVGIIGANGAGKSTLLKVVARGLVPSQGRVRVPGRVSPLLELGAGFHSELTGRENIFLNGTLLGHTRREIASRLHRPVALLQDLSGPKIRTGRVAGNGVELVRGARLPTEAQSAQRKTQIKS